MDITQATNNQLIEEIKFRLLKNEQDRQEMTQLNHTIAELNKKLSESEALKSHFISNISNELINPFTSVMALAENILGVDKENWKKVISMVALIHSEVFNLDFQLKNIIAAAKVEAGEVYPDITLVNIDSLIKNLIDSFKYESRHKKLTIKYTSPGTESPVPQYFKTDAEKIRLIIANLLSNAIKFSYEGGSIEVLVNRLENGNLQITVKDHGQGISEANEQIIFDRFKRLDSGINSVNRGHGLGLSINKALLDLLNGKISHKSRLGKGALFLVEVPEAKEESTGISTDANEIFFKEESF